MRMAIPFHWPTEEETEDSYRRLDSLLRDLYSLLDIILAPARPPPPPTPPDQRRHELRHHHYHHHRRHSNGPSLQLDQSHNSSSADEQMGESLSGGSLPDLVTSTLPSPAIPSSRGAKALPPRPHRSRSRHGSQFECDEKEMDVTDKPSTINFGLSVVQSTSNIQVVQDGDELVSKRSHFETKASSLVSLLVPENLSPTVWTTVLIIVGWKILSRQRS